MKTAAFIVVWLGLVIPATTAEAQGRGRGSGIPPGHVPAPGECRVWYEGRPPGQQPAPTDCRTAEARARRDRSARVIYGGEREGGYWEERDRGEWDRDDRRGRGRAVPRRSPDVGYPRPYPQRSPYPGDPSGRYGYEHPGWDAGYRDGTEKGREDALRNRRYEPNRHGWYRSGTRGYDRRYGSRDEYINIYREAFTAGYADGFR